MENQSTWFKIIFLFSFQSKLEGVARNMHVFRFSEFVFQDLNEFGVYFNCKLLNLLDSFL